MPENALNTYAEPYFDRGNWAFTSAFSYRNSQAAFFAFPVGFGKYKYPAMECAVFPSGSDFSQRSWEMVFAVWVEDGCGVGGTGALGAQSYPRQDPGAEPTPTPASVSVTVLVVLRPVTGSG